MVVITLACSCINQRTGNGSSTAPWWRAVAACLAAVFDSLRATEIGAAVILPVLRWGETGPAAVLNDVRAGAGRR